MVSTEARYLVEREFFTRSDPYYSVQVLLSFLVFKNMHTQFVLVLLQLLPVIYIPFSP